MKTKYSFGFLIYTILFLVSCRDDETANLSQIVEPAFPIVTLKGAPFALVEKGTSYSDAGASSYDSLTGQTVELQPFKNPVNPIREVDVNTVGGYTISFVGKNKLGYETKVSRLVVVYDPNETPIATDNLAGTYKHTNGRQVTVEQIQPGLFYCDDLYGTYTIPIPLYFINYEDGLYIPEQNAPDLGPIIGGGTVSSVGGKYILDFSELERTCCGLRARKLTQQ